MKEEILYTGSVKDILAVENDPETLLFRFSDRYSIFDWGEMPDQLPGKGAALACIGHAFFSALGNTLSWKHWNLPQTVKDSYNVISLFERFKRHGVPHHMIGFSDEMGNDLPKGQVSSYLKVQKIKVVRPTFSAGRYDYSAYKEKFTQTLVPLEVVFRFGAPAGASILKRATDAKYRQEAGLTKVPVAGEWFERPVIEFFTKLETTDRYLTYEAARTLAGLSANELERLINFTMLIAYRLRDYFKAAGLTLWDGKIEVAFDEASENGRRYKLVDSIGPDELRLDFEGVPLSKEVLRSFYRQSEWYQEIEAAKVRAKNQGVKDWKTLVDASKSPAPLSEKQREVATKLYPSLTKWMLDVLHMDEDFNCSQTLSAAELAPKIKEVMNE